MSRICHKSLYDPYVTEIHATGKGGISALLYIEFLMTLPVKPNLMLSCLHQLKLQIQDAPGIAELYWHLPATAITSQENALQPPCGDKEFSSFQPCQSFMRQEVPPGWERLEHSGLSEWGRSDFLLKRNWPT